MSIQEEATRDGQRIAKVMARAGLCSRRDAEKWIAEGRVLVNGEVLTSPAYNVSDADDVIVDGQPLRAAERTRLFMFHKPKGLVTTARDPEGRPTIFEALPEDLPRVVAVGRLDINTEGLILLTNDGGLARVLELPATGWLRRYRVRAHGEITQEQLDGLREGVTIDGVDYRGIEARFERQQGSNVWITMGLREGKNREIKRVLEHLGMSVNRLIRVSFGPFELADLPEGEIMEVRTRVLRDQLGTKLAKQAGVDFEGAAEPEPARDGGREGGLLPPMRPRREGDSSEGPPRKRKHVSVLRTQAREDGAGPRKRVTRTATADRKGRAVEVERVSLARPAEPVKGRRPAAAASAAEGERRGREERAPRRMGSGERSEARERPGARAGRPPREGGEARPPRRAEGTEGSRFSRAPRSAEGREARPPRRTEGAEGARFSRAPRAEGREARPPSRAEGAEGSRFSRPPRAEGREARPPRRAEGAEGSRFSRPPRAEGGAARPPRRTEGAEGSRFSRAPRAESAEGSRFSRAPRAEGAAARPPRRTEGAEGSRFSRAPHAEGREARSPRGAEGGEGSRFSRAPRAEGGAARPPRRAEGAEGSRFSRAPRAEGGAARPPRRTEGAEGSRFSRAPRAEGGAARPPRRAEGAEGSRFSRAPRAEGGKGGGRPAGKGRPSGGPSRGPGGKGPGGKGGPRRPRGD